MSKSLERATLLTLSFANIFMEEQQPINKTLMAMGIMLCLLLAGSAVYYFKNYPNSASQTAGPLDEKSFDNAQDKQPDTIPPSPETTAGITENTPTSVWQIIKPVDQEDHVLGSSNAKITIVLYSDIECFYCKNFHHTMEQIIEEYGKNETVRWVYRHFPLEQLHPTAPKEAEATECAAELGGNAKFWEYINKLIDGFSPSQTDITNQLTNIAEEIGLNKNKFQTCLESGKHTEKINQSSSEAVMLGAQGTPFSIMVDQYGKIAPIPGALPYEQVKETVELMLNPPENQ